MNISKRSYFSIVSILLGFSLLLFAFKSTAGTVGSAAIPKNSEHVFGLKPEHKAKIADAMSDYDLVLKGGNPKFAVPEYDLLDGGSRVYKGKGYMIKIVEAMGSIEGVDGYFRGAILTFGKEEIDRSESLSSVKFYTLEELKEFTKNASDTKPTATSKKGKSKKNE